MTFWVYHGQTEKTGNDDYWRSSELSKSRALRVGDTDACPSMRVRVGEYGM
jgi:hypothetical protein